MDETPQKDSDISSDALLNTPLPVMLNNPIPTPLADEKLNMSPDQLKSEEKRPQKRIIRRKRGGSEGQLESDSEAGVSNEKDFRLKMPMEPHAASDADKLNDFLDGKPNSVVQSEDEKPSQPPVVRRRRVKAIQKPTVEEPAIEDETGWTKDLDFK